jgi:hypothetical protein
VTQSDLRVSSRISRVLVDYCGTVWVVVVLARFRDENFVDRRKEI